jgi:hypothetical protein
MLYRILGAAVLTDILIKECDLVVQVCENLHSTLGVEEQCAWAHHCALAPLIVAQGSRVCAAFGRGVEFDVHDLILSSSTLLYI